MTDSTCIIVTWNSAAVIGACLEHVPPELPVIVVDNASTDRTTDIIATSGRDITLRQTGSNAGFGRAANRGLEAVTTRHALLLNPDTLVHTGTIATLEHAAREFPRRPLLAPAVFDGNNRQVSRYRDLHTGEPAGAAQADVAAVSGCALYFNMDALAAIGHFDEAFFLYYEETDLCRRALQYGQPVRYIPEARVTHIGGSSSGGGARGSLLAHFEWSRCYYHRKHGDDAGRGGAIRRRKLRYGAKKLWYRVVPPHFRGTEYYWREFGTGAFLQGLDADSLLRAVATARAPG